MKSALEIMDNFSDDFFSGLIDANIDDTSKRIKSEFWEKSLKSMTDFLRGVTEYRKIKDKEARSNMAESMMANLGALRTLGFFKFVDSAVVILKVENENLRKENKDLAKEVESLSGELGYKKELQAETGIGNPEKKGFTAVR